jgi:Ser/Thr protein kinase RdoA (MazF antagonist)
MRLIGRPLLPRPSRVRRSLATACTILSRLEQATLQAVCAQYKLGRPRAIRPLGGGWRGTSFVVDFGPGQRAVLKRYKTTMTQEAVAYEHSILDYLELASFRAPRPMRNCEGGTCTTWNGHHYAAFTFIPGFCYADFFVTEMTRRHYIARAGQALASYHCAVAGFTPAGQKHDGYRPDGHNRWESAEQHQQVLLISEVRLAEYHNICSAGKYLLEQLPRLRADLAALEHQIAAVEATLHKLPIHGDFGPSNVRCQRDGELTMMDFECARLDLRAYDVIFSLVSFARRGGTLDIGRAHAFFGAYQATYPLPYCDVQWMPIIFQFVQLRSLANGLRDYLAGSTRVAASMLARLQWVRWMASHGRSLIETLWEVGMM